MIRKYILRLFTMSKRHKINVTCGQVRNKNGCIPQWYMCSLGASEWDVVLYVHIHIQLGQVDQAVGLKRKTDCGQFSQCYKNEFIAFVVVLKHIICASDVVPFIVPVWHFSPPLSVLLSQILMYNLLSLTRVFSLKLEALQHTWILNISYINKAFWLLTWEVANNLHLECVSSCTSAANMLCVRLLIYMTQCQCCFSVIGALDWGKAPVWLNVFHLKRDFVNASIFSFCVLLSLLRVTVLRLFCWLLVYKEAVSGPYEHTWISTGCCVTTV